jgi:Protein of unknown function (Porph_ging).
MEYKKLLKMGTLFIVLFLNLLQAQNYRVYYQMTYKKDSSNFETTKKNMVLLIKDNQSKFYSQEQFINDSIVIEKQKTGGKTLKKYDYNFMAIKDNKEKKLYKFTSLLRDLYKTSENAPDFNWKISHETKKVENYTCQKATLEYAGRIWEIWFTPDIAIQEGPYIFNGLPGLIVYMKDLKDNFEFNFTGIKKDETTDINYLSAKPLDVTKKQLNKVLIDHYNDPYREMKTGNIKVRWQDEDGKEFKPDYNELTKTEQKNIKKNNNPIELSEAIHYP